jgi:hypothetical protein
MPKEFSREAAKFEMAVVSGAQPAFTVQWAILGTSFSRRFASVAPWA